jgi:hypothetical protein
MEKPEDVHASCASPCSPPIPLSLGDLIEARLQWLKDNPGPVVGWVPQGDYLSIFWEDVPYHAVTASGTLTLYKSIDDDRVVGCAVSQLTMVMRMTSSWLPSR